jgi:two-component system OmpR family response regulator
MTLLGDTNINHQKYKDGANIFRLVLKRFNQGFDLNSGPHILVVDDDREIRTLLQQFLAGQSFRVSIAADGHAMEACLLQEEIDLIVLDVMLPEKSGLDLCRSLRSRSKIPIILLTALKEDIDRIVGLELGADDYIGKPFNPRELVARIRAVLRRVDSPSPQAAPAGKFVRFASFRAYVSTRTVLSDDGEQVTFTGAEFDLLLAFLDRPGRVLSRDQLIEITKGRSGASFDRSIDVTISRIRRKLSLAGSGNILRTLRNGGYQLAVETSTR